MKNLFLSIFFLFAALGVQAQSVAEPVDSSWTKVYRGSYPRINDIIHTKLEVKFDYNKSYMYGKEWLTLKPHFYPTDSLLLDAKGMDIAEVIMFNNAKKIPLKYQYDSLELKITLDRIYKKNEKYTIYIAYTSKPNGLKIKSSLAINDAKGLYFINPKGEEKDKSIQIWTQGETESNSAWMPTIDKPNQKSTEEIYMTVPQKYVTLSNGMLVSQKKNTDGTRTDYWKMDLPHAPYLFFMGVGDFAIIKDQYNGKEVSYYVEKKYASVARKIFGNTPEMMKFFSQKLGVEYPWNKYSQMVVNDYVSGAMENTTATLHGSFAYQNARELTDHNAWEGVIAHELFHHWFGDLVTAESWSNLTVNESMADFSQTLWMEYKYGKDAGDEENQSGLRNYLSDSSVADKDLVRFRYADKEDMFDLVSYQKGGRVLQMLRNYVGEEAFFQSLNLYLTANKFKTGEADQMRLAFEEITGQDLNWFWNQWYFSNGHPELKIDYQYNDTAKKATVIVQQMQKTNKIFRLPVAVDVYEGSGKKRYNVWIENKTDTLTFAYSKHPDLINFDAEKVLLCTKTDNKTPENYIHQIEHAPLYVDRMEALNYFAKNDMKELISGLTDKYPKLREKTIGNLEKSKFAKDSIVVSMVYKLASNEKNKYAKAAAINFLNQTKNPVYKSLYENNVNDSSYSVAGAALEGLIALTPEQGYTLAKKYSTDAKERLATVVLEELAKKGNEADLSIVTGLYASMPTWRQMMKSENFADYFILLQDTATIKQGVDMLLKFRNEIPVQYRMYTDPGFRKGLDKLAKAKGQETSDYIERGMR